MKAPAFCPAQFRRRLLAWFRRHARDLPWRHHRSPYAVLVAELMLQQTQAATVADHFTRWLRRFPDFRALAAATEDEVLHAWQGLGYYARARSLWRAARAVVERHGGALPAVEESLRALPGVGPYTAAALLAFAFDRPVPVLDANTVRVLARLSNFTRPADAAAGRAYLHRYARALQPARGGRNFNEALMELGALVCLPRLPHCAVCPVRVFCAAKNPAALPHKKSRPRTVALVEDCAFITRADGALLLERSHGPRWPGLWRLPAWHRRHRPPAGRLLYQTVHTVTRHRITLRVHRRDAPRRLASGQRWFVAPEDAPMPVPHRRAVQAIRRATA